MSWMNTIVGTVVLNHLIEAVPLDGGVAPSEPTTAPEELSTPTITERYVRPANATNAAQRASVQGKACVTCGKTGKMVADHKTPLVVEYYETGTIDEARMKSLDAVQPQCPPCSAKQGAEYSKYSKEMRAKHDLPEEE
jgi:hypothetical protein